MRVRDTDNDEALIEQVLHWSERLMCARPVLSHECDVLSALHCELHLVLVCSTAGPFNSAAAHRPCVAGASCATHCCMAGRAGSMLAL